MTAAVRDQQLTVVGVVVYHSYGARLLYGTETATYQWIPYTPKRREENRIYLYAAVNLKRKYR